jgi:hypothetical protein
MSQASHLAGRPGMALDVAPVTPAIRLGKIINELGVGRPEPAHQPVSSAFLIPISGVSP